MVNIYSRVFLQFYRKAENFSKNFERASGSYHKKRYAILAVLALSTTAYSTTVKAMFPDREDGNKTNSIRPQENLVNWTSFETQYCLHFAVIPNLFRDLF